MMASTSLESSRLQRSRSFNASSSHASPTLSRPIQSSLFHSGMSHRVTPTSNLLGGDTDTQSLETQTQFEVTWDDPTSRAQMAKLAPDLAKKCSESLSASEHDDDGAADAQNEQDNDVTRDARSDSTVQLPTETTSFDSFAQIDLQVCRSETDAISRVIHTCTCMYSYLSVLLPLMFRT